MDRGSDKHGARMDEELDHETQGLTRGGPADGRAEEWHEPEPSADDEPAVAFDPEPGPHDDLAEFGSYLRRSAFPATGRQLVREAEANQAPDHVLDGLRRLDGTRDYATVAEAWAAVTGESEHGHRF